MLSQLHQATLFAQQAGCSQASLVQESSLAIQASLQDMELGERVPAPSEAPLLDLGISKYLPKHPQGNPNVCIVEPLLLQCEASTVCSDGF